MLSFSRMRRPRPWERWLARFARWPSGTCDLGRGARWIHRGLFRLDRARPDAPPSGASPFDWRWPSWLRDVVGARIEIELCEQMTTLNTPDVATVWTEYVNGFGSVAATYT